MSVKAGLSDGRVGNDCHMAAEISSLWVGKPLQFQKKHGEVSLLSCDVKTRYTDE